MNEKKPLEVTITLPTKDITLSRILLQKAKKAMERQAKKQTDPAEQTKAQENSEYIAKLEQKLFDATIEVVKKAKKES